MEISFELKIAIFVISIFLLWTIFQMLFLKYTAPRIVLFFDRFHDSYKYCIKFIKKNEKIKELLGEVKIIESLPAPNYPMGFMGFPKYRFHLHGTSQSAILNIIMHWGRELNQGVWVIDTADLEMKGAIIDLRTYIGNYEYEKQSK